MFLCAALTACAGPAPMPLDPPPVEAKARPALAIAPLVRLDRASAERPQRTGTYVQSALVSTVFVECLCGEGGISDTRGFRQPCTECGSTDLREPFSPPYRADLNVHMVRTRAGALLEERGVFSRVVLLPADDPTIDPDLGVTPEVRHDWRETARARGARWLLEPVLDECRVELVEKNGYHALKVVNLIVCSILIFPAVDPINWVIPGEDYGVVQRLTWRLTDLEAGLVSDGARDLTTKASFNALGPGPSREFYVVGFLRAPGCLDEEAWAEIAEQLTPTAAEDLARALVVAAESSARELR